MGGTLWMKAEIFMNSSKISVEKPADFAYYDHFMSILIFELITRDRSLDRTQTGIIGPNF